MRAWTLLIAFAVAFFFSAASMGENRGERINKEKNLEDVRKKIREEKARISEIMKRESGVLGEVERIGKNLSEKREEIRKVTSSLKRLDARITEAEYKMKRLEQRRLGLSERLDERLRGIYKMRNGELLNAFVGGEGKTLSYSPAAGRRHKYVTTIMDSDTRLLEECEANIVELRAERRRLGGLYAETQETKNSLVSREKEASAIKGEKLALLTDIKREKDVHEKVLKELEDASKRLAEIIKRLGKEEEAARPGGTGFAALKGSLPMPVEGVISSHYGKVEHPKFKTITFNNGIIISAPVGRPVVNVYDGEVAYTGWLKGYGQIIIVDHGGGFYTLFAHLDKILKDKGARVARGEEIALVGDSGPNGSPGLYFEIREKGVPRDPVAWFASR